MSPASKAQQKAVNKYIKSNYAQLHVALPKGKKAEIQEHANTQGESISAFVARAINETIERDKQK